MTTSPNPQPSLPQVVDRLRAALAAGLTGGEDPRRIPAVLEDLEQLEQGYEGTAEKKVAAFAEAIRNPASVPGVSRAVVLARGQRFLLTLAVEMEDRVAAGAPRKKQKAETRPRPAPTTPFDPELLSLPGIGPKTASRLASRGLPSVTDLLFLLPRRYDDRRTVTPIAELTPGSRSVTAGEVAGVRLYGRPWRRIMELRLEDGEATIRGMWFSNRRPRPERFEKGKRVVLAGLVSDFKGKLQIAHPVVVDEDGDSDLVGRIVPVYPEVPGVAGRTVEKSVRAAASRAEEIALDPLPRALLERRGLMTIGEALELVHIPPADVPIEALDAWVEGSSPAHRRLAYDEFFFIQLALALRRRRAGAGEAPPAGEEPGTVAELEELVGFAPTTAQRRVISEIAADMSRDHPMQRLLQGDVGSGKTFVALAAIVTAVRAGLQAALMVPTEILAEQHMRTLYPILDRLGIRAVLHLGAARSSTRKKNLAALERGTAQVAIGTHALIQESVSFRSLGLAVVDEQHRFGVSQRLGLVGKGPRETSPHLLVMTATPIPRTLALTVHGDLDFSVIDELPPGRTPVETRLHTNDNRAAAFEAAARALERGEQVYVVCPIIEESSTLDVRAAEEVHEELAARFGDEKVGLLHGRLSSEEKEAVMEEFAAGRVPLLVTTTVVEVGVDVPRATVMVVEGAERFGLAQLHQLRGRVGRSDLASSCQLIADPSNGNAMQRLAVLAATADGFEVAEADLANRGPGELYGRRQAGLPGFRFGDLMRDTELLDAAREDVGELLGRDPDLDGEEVRVLREELARRLLADDAPVGEEAG